ncbi:hypothetical protein DPQ33_07430 [Oceanidesulfovibrio indonesiensis]|uniref:Uncharacterized protein n=1 Tax=Oceanidesulfovibrio indonesiensis TaxID=54767 RepID=A0A7M3MGD3_9BACT|nr:hypothetical protein [Oceanidesulfovibrio indonesiensis]TVM17932.1 hypothetical protein DPQ33_07430 [Oceanidesulfovibrio indonesiensis]
MSSPPRFVKWTIGLGFAASATMIGLALYRLIAHGEFDSRVVEFLILSALLVAGTLVNARALKKAAASNQEDEQP